MINAPPNWLPAIGSTVHLKPRDSKAKPAAYTIDEYKEYEPGEWVFRATGPRGIRLTDGIETLR